MYQKTTATDKIFALDKRIRAVAGGTSASKTISILFWLIDRAQSASEPELISIVSESFPHLRRGVMRDFLNIMRDHKYFREDRWSKTDYTYTFESGSRIEFFSADQPSKVRGPRREILFLNECNNVEYEAYDQLEVRTKKVVWLDWNPTREFWFYTDVLEQREDDLDFITLTYKDNEALDPQIVKSIEARKANKAWWRVYGEGQLGEVEGKIYRDWQIVDDLPHTARLERYGLDFGYSQDPAVCVAIYYHDGGYIIDEVFHDLGMTNRQIADHIKNLKPALLIADSAEPKSIDEIKSYGVRITGAQKGQGSVNQGIQYVQDQRVSVTKRSLNVIKSYRNYMWKTDKDGNILNVPDHAYSDAMDAVRYGLENIKPTGEFKVKRNSFYTQRR